MMYIATITEYAKDDFQVIFHDFPGCVTWGDTLDEAHRRATEALEFHIEGTLEDGLTLPEPSSIGAVREAMDELDKEDDPSLSRTYVTIIPIIKNAKANRYNITFDSGLMRSIDEVAKQHGMSRSALLAKAAEEYVHEHC